MAFHLKGSVCSDQTGLPGTTACFKTLSFSWQWQLLWKGWWEGSHYSRIAGLSKSKAGLRAFAVLRNKCTCTGHLKVKIVLCMPGEANRCAVKVVALQTSTAEDEALRGYKLLLCVFHSLEEVTSWGSHLKKKRHRIKGWNKLLMIISFLVMGELQKTPTTG